MSRYARRTDKGHAAIVAALRQLGCAVLDLSRLGGDVPDLLVWRPDRGRVSVSGPWLVEVKREDRTGGNSGLSKGQRQLMKDWPGPTCCLWSVEDGIAWATGHPRPPMPAWAQRQEQRRGQKEAGDGKG
jgi:hypothetical protein